MKRHGIIYGLAEKEFCEASTMGRHRDLNKVVAECGTDMLVRSILKGFQLQFRFTPILLIY